MISLATPLYFQKLWTMFEISLFITLHKVEKLRVQPPSLAVAALSLSLWATVMNVVYRFLMVQRCPKWCVWLLICLLLFAGARTMRWWSIQLASIRRHATSFKIETAMCKEEADRRMVSEILIDFSRTQMIASPKDSKEVALSKFEASMHQTVPKAILARVGPSGLSLQVIFSIWLPSLAAAFDRVGAAAQQVIASKEPPKLLCSTLMHVCVAQTTALVIICTLSYINVSNALGYFDKILPPRLSPSASVPAFLLALLVCYIVGAIQLFSNLYTNSLLIAVPTSLAFCLLNSMLLALMVGKWKPFAFLQ